MKKRIYTFLMVVTFCIFSFGCNNNYSTVSKITVTDSVHFLIYDIKDEKNIKTIEKLMKKAKWKPHDDATPRGSADFILFLDYKKISKVDRYSIWFQNDGTVEIIQSNKKKGFTKLNKASGKILRTTLENAKNNYLKNQK